MAQKPTEPEVKTGFVSRWVRVSSIKMNGDVYLNAYDLDIWLSRLAETIHRPLGKPSAAYQFVAEAIRTLEKDWEKK